VTDAIPEPARALLEAANIAHLATLMADGTPHVTPVWVDVEDSLVLVNSAEGRVKVRNLRRDPRVGLSVVDRENPYAAVSIRGRVREIAVDGADEHIDALARKYLGEERYPMRQPGEQRVIIRIDPARIFGPRSG
jgi:PPOX class probable F420-dependent enzyme